MTPAAITHELRLQPEHCFRAGEPRESRSGIAAAAVHSESYWIATLNPAAWPTASSAFDMSFPGRPRLAVSKERLRAMMRDSLAWLEAEWRRVGEEEVKRWAREQARLVI